MKWWCFLLGVIALQITTFVDQAEAARDSDGDGIDDSVDKDDDNDGILDIHDTDDDGDGIPDDEDYDDDEEL
jgi:hypothetical protein